MSFCTAARFLCRQINATGAEALRARAGQLGSVLLPPATGADMGDRYHHNRAYDNDAYYDHPAEHNRFHSSGDLSNSGSASGGSYADPRDRDLEAGDGYSVPDDTVRV